MGQFDGYIKLPDAIVHMAARDHRKALKKLLTVEEEILRDTEDLTRIMRSIQSSINDVPDSSCRLILEMRYLAFIKWEDIASELGWTKRNVFYVHGKALRLVKIPA